ncbi:IclR family transcriptional regulator [Jiangella sp. DSM 45060]|uniref:IclR family transcriptional regulator n=1 Tax=Jiangella sp. DSM 45060 TaxID=1798224 RepID=UPI000879E2A9|nr:IclR family transcriptional regulator [Jiangella sp. DSM 45060]SDS45340.1 transcriptional regulator, IclR family [Jiangella sp. DSM 45060]
MAAEAPDPPAARTLLRGLTLLEIVAAAPDGISVTAVAAAADLDKGTTSRLLSALRERGYVRQREKDRHYTLGGRAMRLTQAFQVSKAHLSDVAGPHLRALRDQTGETVHLAVREGDSVVYLDEYQPDRSLFVRSSVGRRLDLRVTAMGRAILAALTPHERAAVLARLAPEPVENHADLADLSTEIERAAAHGWATVNRHDDVIRLGAAITDASGEPVAAVTVSGPTYRVKDHRDELGSACVRTARLVSHDLGA